MSTATYWYRPLRKEEQEFRILQLLPLPESSQEPLQCRMKRASLKELKPMKEDDFSPPSESQYEAISYCWGDPAPTAVIYLDGKILRLPVSSEKALRRVACPDRTRTVYLDAVCINQADLAERSSQVLFMADIYRHAQTTLVYLGEGDQYIARAFTNLRSLHRELRILQRGFIEQHGRLPESDEEFIRFEIPVEVSLDEHALLGLLRSGWFQRVWVVQEVAVAANCSLICGADECDMTTVLEVVWWLISNDTHRMLASELYPALQNANRIRLAKVFVLGGSGQALTRTLMQARQLQASDQRDKVFGILGLLDQQDPFSRLLTPDYTKSVRHVFRDATRQSLAGSDSDDNDILILDSISHRDESDLMYSPYPSWVPKLDRPHDVLLDGGFLPLWTRKCWRPVDHGNPATAEVTNDPDVLVLPGVKVCSVWETSASAYDPTSSSSAEAIATWYETATMMFQNHSIPAPDVARTLLADDNNSGELIPPDPHRELSTLLQCVRDQIDLPFPPWIDSTHDPSIMLASHYCFRANLICGARRLAVMSNGTAGLVPRLTRPSDQVVVVHGPTKARMFMLRPRGDEFLFIGACYVDGWMPWQEHGDEVQQRLLTEEPTMFKIR